MHCILALHEGALARHLTVNAIELSVVLEEAIVSELHQVSDFMVRKPVCALVGCRRRRKTGPLWRRQLDRTVGYGPGFSTGELGLDAIQDARIGCPEATLLPSGNELEG